MFLDRGSKVGRMAGPEVGETVAGWRLVRPLTPDGREFIGVAEFASTVVETGSEHWSGFTDPALPRLQHRRLVIAAGQEDGVALAVECALRDEVGSEFVELAEEILTEDHVRVAVFPIRRVRSWRDIVAAGVELEPGAVVTALVPIVEAIGLAHRHGIAHGSIGLAACHFDELGRPSLDAWGSATRLEGIPTMKADLARANDLRALGRLSDTLLELTTQGADGQLRQLVDALREGVTPSDAIDRLIDALFRWSEPGPLPEAVLPRGSVRDAPHGREGRHDNAVSGVVASTALRNAAISAETVESLLPEPDDDPARGHLGRLRALGAAASAWASRVRPRIWAAVGFVGALTIVGGVLLATGGNTEGAATETAAAKREDAAIGFDANTPPASSAGIEPEPAGAADATTQAIETESVDTDTPDDMDALDALPGLLQARSDCLVAADPDCLAALYSADSPGLEADLENLSSSDPAEAKLDHEQDWALAADLGDIELFTGSASGSVSLERTPDGWRLREIWAG